MEREKRVSMTPALSHLGTLSARLEQRFPYFAKTIGKRLEDFGEAWALDFEEELAKFFDADEEALKKATDGYGTFALDAMKLQKRFDKERCYINKNYADVAKAVYHSRDYMFDLYLPGILLSQYLWPHHYRQLLFFRNRFIPRARQIPVRLFFDVGVGTGFYSKEMLRLLPDASGRGFDISEHSLAHTTKMLDRWKLSQHYDAHRQDILSYDNDVLADAIVSVEVLEHLENPPQFLDGLRRMLRRGGIGYITAAINAPNADHIYLYRSGDDVAREIEAAGFSILDRQEFFGYVARSGESVPSGGVFIVGNDR
jgi:2-polyprenyl-3-methyl-5-hydroxy-6-metoxy-1,4-benzoquinol methylase